ncbi:unnamed protein product [Diabrotica balteata]|uniref:Uncharacterized protein n=1 Tax=Diabrotica balteata TaxID=107213 RepID=A0A9N9XKU3_DIABA|nr:unnamed protein product [Diabrotica balteata]
MKPLLTWFFRRDTIKNGLDNPYHGSFPVVKRGDKTFVVRVNGKEVTISIDRLKPAYEVNVNQEPEKITLSTETNTDNNFKNNRPKRQTRFTGSYQASVS